MLRVEARWGGVMARLIRCECGFVARGADDDQVVGVIREHLAADHPAMVATVSDEELQSWIQAE
jgi:predicted small metal-binding protein